MNGLLNGLVEYWQPDVELGSLKGMVAGIDFDTFVGTPPITIVDFPSPSGKAISLAENYGGAIARTSPNTLLADWGSSEDFLAMAWVRTGTTLSFVIGEDNNSGFDFGTYSNPTAIFAEIPFSDGSYDPFINTGNGFLIANTLYLLMFWWTVLDKTMHLQISGKSELTQTSLIGAGAPDETNFGQFSMGSNGIDTGYQCDAAIWRGTIPDAIQRALLFAGTPFSAFDSGGGGGPVGAQTVFQGVDLGNSKYGIRR